MTGNKLKLEGYVTASDIVNKLGVKNPSVRRKIYKYIKNIVYSMYPDKFDELLFTDKSYKRYVMKIPKKDVDVLLKRLEEYRIVKKTELIYQNGQLVKRETIVKQW